MNIIRKHFISTQRELSNALEESQSVGAYLKMITCCFRPHIGTLHLDQVKLDEMGEEVFTITNEVYLKKNCYLVH